MGRPWARVLPLLAVALIALGAWRLWPGSEAQTARLLDPAALAAALPADADAGFEQLQEGADWAPLLPADLGPHPAFRTELWDLTGQLRDPAGRRFGLRLTLVRLGLRPPTQQRERPSRLAADALMFGRLALVPPAGKPVQVERVSRTAAGLAGATSAPAEVWLQDWRLRLSDGDKGATLGRLEANADGMHLDLTLTTEKPVIAPVAKLLNGGGAAAGATPGFRWLAAPRLRVDGHLTRPDGDTAVTGSAWLDRVWGSAATGVGLAGTRGQLALNRFLLQLDDGSELLCIHLRRRAGGGTPLPTCLHVSASGNTRVLDRRDVTLFAGETKWQGAAGGAAYPLAWRLAAPALRLELDIEALHRDQEILLGERLWSGAVTASGERSGQPVAGGGRMDLSGYEIR
jgi:predicted secreted hydrolase